MTDMKNPEETQRGYSRRDVIKGVIAAGAVSSAGYLFRGPIVWAASHRLPARSSA